MRFLFSITALYISGWSTAPPVALAFSSWSRPLSCSSSAATTRSSASFTNTLDLGDTTTAVSRGGISTRLHVSIGLGPDKRLRKDDEGDDDEGGNKASDDGEVDDNEKRVLVAGVDYEIPDHEAFRTSRRSKLDEQCDNWFGALLGSEDDKGVLGPLADEARKMLVSPVELVNEVRVEE